MMQLPTLIIISCSDNCQREIKKMLSLCQPPAPATRPSPNVDDGLTSLSWLQNLNMCMTRLGAPTPPTPPASPNHRSGLSLYLSPDPAPSSSEPLCKPGDAVPRARHPQSTSSCNPTSKKASSRSSPANPKSQRTPAPSSSSSPPVVPVPEETVDYKSNGTTKPPFSYATLICMAMKANKNKMTLNSIYKWIRENFLYYQNADPSWQVCPLTPHHSLPCPPARLADNCIRQECCPSRHSVVRCQAGKERK